MKKKEVLKRLSAVSMAAMMTVTMIPSNAYAADELFSDVEVETSTDAEDEDSTDVAVSDADDTSDADIEVEAEDDNADVNVEEDEEDNSESVDAFSDGGDSAEETDAFDAGEGTPAADAVVHMTVSVAGELATAKDGTLMADRDVTVKDIDKNGILTYDEALIAAHDEYYNGGAVAGYASADSEQYGKYITKFWGDTSGAFGYWRNDNSCFNLSDEVKADDYLNAFVYKDTKKYTDVYTKFDKKEYKVSTGSQMTVAVKKASFDEAGKLVYTDCDGAVLSAYDSDLQPLGADAYTVDGYKVTFHKAGTYYLTATGTDNMNLVPAAAKVTVADWKSPFANIRFYKSDMDYENGAEPIAYTPAYNGEEHQYTAIVPDYLSSVYAVANYGADVKKYTVMYTTSWGSWGSGHGSLIEENADTGEAYFQNGRAGVYYSDGSSDAIEKAYYLNVSQYTTLRRLVIDGIIDKKFNRDTNTYHAYVDGTKDGVSIKPTAYKTGYTITVNGTEVTSGKAYTLPFHWDKNGKMDVDIVVSKEGMGSSTYKVDLEKLPKEDKPFIYGQPQKNTDYIINDETRKLSVGASANGELAYQWYVNTTDSNEGGTPVEGATEAAYKPASDKVGTFYYYCVVTNTGKTENNKTSTETACVVIEPDPTPVATITTVGNKLPDDYSYAWETGYVYNIGDTAVPLKVNATTAVKGGELSYEWYYANELDASTSYGADYEGDKGISATYIPSTKINDVNTSGRFYKCRVTCTYKGETYRAWATTGQTYTKGEGEDAKTYDTLGTYVFVKTDHATKPEILTQPVSASYIEGDTTADLKILARTVAERGDLTYQWYVNDAESTENGTAVDGATNSSFKFKAEEPGTKYYYCVVTNTIQGHTASTTSQIAKIEIQSKNVLIADKLSGSGTQEDPYLVKTAEDYQSVYDLVAQGISFKGLYLCQKNDITLPSGWKPIGVTKDGSNDIKRGDNLYPFSGILDGNNKTLTVPEGGQPLLGYIKEAEVRNLNIYGTKIAGYGLVNNFEGVGLHGSAIIIENVTLKSGSRTWKSGLIGGNMTTNGYAGNSAGYDATIRNCTIEKDVVVGYTKDQSEIGAFAGRMQGVIENCVSYATVYGKDYVGGIIGTRDNAMGTCTVRGCQFRGTVEASGQHAGGIVGGGYQNVTAPNGVKISVISCKADGTVTGADKVGGILGGDTYEAQAWNPYTMKGNSFTGKVKVTGENASYIGGIIGYYDSLNKFDDITNNYYAKDCGADKGIGFVKYVDTNCTTHETTSGATYFSTEENTNDCPAVSGCEWRAQHNRTDDPLGADAAKLANTDGLKLYVEKLEISGDYRTEFYLGEELDLTGMTVKAQMSDGTTRDVAVSDITVEGYHNEKRGNQSLTVSYEGASVQIPIKVLKKDPENIKIHFELLGDKVHGAEDKDVHTLRANNLETWIVNQEYEVGGNATVLDVMAKILTDNEYTWENTTGNYIASITKADGTKLAEKQNGANSGWMYTLNGIHSNLGVAEQYLEDGDIIVFHYTDDYTQEHDHIWSSKWTTDENAHWHECTYEFNDCDITDNTKKSGYGTHTFDEGKVTKAATCKEAGEKVYTCTVCGATKTEVLPKTNDHKYTWKVVSKATVFAPEKQQGTCSVCGAVVNKDNGTKLIATIKLNATSIKLQKKQTTKKIRVAMANGDSVRSWRSSNKKIATVNSKGVIKAGKKTGTAKITVTLKSGKKATLKVKVQTSRVRTTKISGLKKNVTLKKGRKLALRPVISPLTSQEKVTYTSSNKKVATVSKNGTITAKKKGTVKITVRSGKKSYVVKVKVK